MLEVWHTAAGVICGEGGCVSPAARCFIEILKAMAKGLPPRSGDEVTQ
jgi:hypothetical protein